MRRAPGCADGDGASPAVAMRDLLAAAGYIADDELASALFLADALERPLLLEGEAGVGKTAAATALAAALKPN